jgi:hypothetical protein
VDQGGGGDTQIERTDAYALRTKSFILLQTAMIKSENVHRTQELHRLLKLGVGQEELVRRKLTAQQR